MIEQGTVIDLYYYGENNSVRSLRAALEDAGPHGVIVIDLRETVQFFPWTSVQRIVPTA